MNVSIVSVIGLVVAVVFLLVIIGLAILVGTSVKGRAAGLAIIGLSLLALSRLLVVVVPLLVARLFQYGDGYVAYLTGQNVVLTLMNLAGIGLLAFAVITASRSSRGPAPSGPAPYPPGPQPGPPTTYPT